MSRTSRCFIGDVEYSIDAPERIKKLLSDEFDKEGQFKSKHKVRWEIAYRPALSDKNHDKKIKKEEKGTFFDTGYTAEVEWENKRVIIYYDERILNRPIISKIARAWDWSYMSPEEIFVKNSIYDILEPVSHIIMGENGLGFIHSSTISSEDNEAFLFTGEGGVGKTALAIEGFKTGLNYMNDDLSLIDNKGFCYHYPKKLQIYGYNLHSSRFLKKRLFQKSSILDKIMWKFRYGVNGPSGVRRKVDPAELFGGSITNKSRIKNIFFLENDEELGVEPIVKDEFLDKEIEVIKKEFSDFINFLKEKEKERYYRFVENTEELYEHVYEKSGCFKISIPDDMDFKKAFEFIREEALL
ncbi:MAG: hypothetical protein ACOC6U_00890 [Thermoplasmatota archaeon]